MISSPKFLFGLIVGVAIGVLAMAYLGSSEDRPAETLMGPVGTAAVDSRADEAPAPVERRASGSPSRSDDAAAAAGRAERTAARDGSESVGVPDSIVVPDPAARPSQRSIDPAALGLSEPHRALVGDLDADNLERGKAAKVIEFRSEPIDTDWGYFTEQAARQYIGSHPMATQFDVLDVSCRSTACQFQIVGIDEDSGPYWQLVLQDMQKEAWVGDFRGNLHTTSDDIDGRQVILTHWQLRRSDASPQAVAGTSPEFN